LSHTVHSFVFRVPAEPDESKRPTCLRNLTVTVLSLIKEKGGSATVKEIRERTGLTTPGKWKRLYEVKNVLEPADLLTEKNSTWTVPFLGAR
jgi:hypothetical protein